MISRRAFFGTGLGVAGVAGALAVAGAAHRLDDLARAVGLEPRPRPVPADTRLLAEVAADQDALLATVAAAAARHAGLADELERYLTIGREHVEALGGSRTVPAAQRVAGDAAAAVDALAASYLKASRRRAGDARDVASPDLARVLSAMSAGLAQCAETVVELR